MADIITALGTAFSGVATNVTSVITTIVPIAVGIVGVVWVVKKGIRWFKSMSNA